MHRVVLDTNVLVSALLRRDGAPALVLNGALEGRWSLLVSPEILEEYAATLSRSKFRIPAGDVAELAAGVRRSSIAVFPREPVQACSDPDDDKFLSCALAGAATHLVTGNLKDFPKASFAGVLIVSPRQFLDCP